MLPLTQTKTVAIYWALEGTGIPNEPIGPRNTIVFAVKAW